MRINENYCLGCDAKAVEITDNEYGNEYRCQFCGISYNERIIRLVEEAGAEAAKKELDFDNYWESNKEERGKIFKIRMIELKKEEIKKLKKELRELRELVESKLQ